MIDKTKIILIREGTIGSIISDLFSFLLFAGLIGIGLIAGSTIMQIIGAFIAMMFVYVRTDKTIKSSKMSLEEAAKKIADWQAEQ